ncbi:MAG: 50S ribosomal protein L29 [Desulfobacteraceae bacterium IS3]|nr:MAG: 50S ribosomal protein L29 [Desulfobacteraceae bacterium IS3]
MKASEIRLMSVDEMQRKLGELTEEIFNLRFRHGIGQLENPRKIKASRRDAARLKTIIKESEK